jgi:hypothetical protein
MPHRYSRAENQVIYVEDAEIAYVSPPRTCASDHGHVLRCPVHWRDNRLM